MRRLALLKVAVQSIRKNTMRTLLTMLGIVIGVGAVIVMVAIGHGAQSRIQQQISSLGTNMIVISPGSGVQGGMMLGAGTMSRLTVEDADQLAREATAVSAVSPVVFMPVQLIGGEGNWRTRLNGVSPEYQTIRDWPVQSGVFFSDDDVIAMRRVVVIGATIAAGLFPGADPVGAPLQIRDVPFTIVGVLAPKGQTAGGSDQDDIVVVPYTTAQARLRGMSFIGQILVSATSPEEIPAAQADIRAILREAHGLVPGDADDFTVRTQDELAQAAQSTTEVMSLLLAAIASISLVVGGIGIMNIMLVSVTERTHEIGIRLAVGARGSDVMAQFLIESVVVSILGGLLGLAAGYAGAAVLGRITGWSTATPPVAVLIAVGFSALVGVFFGFYPARKAAQLNPIDALRHE
jgi:putative ABC transport system permease protein